MSDPQSAQLTVDALLGERWRVDYTDPQRGKTLIATRVDGLMLRLSPWGADVHVSPLPSNRDGPFGHNVFVTQRNGKLRRFPTVGAPVDTAYGEINKSLVQLVLDWFDRELCVFTTVHEVKPVLQRIPLDDR